MIIKRYSLIMQAVIEWNQPDRRKIMDRAEIFEKIKDIVVEQLGIEEPDKIQMETSMTKDLEADSLYVIEVIMAIEEEFDIEIPDEEAEQFSTMEDIVNYVAEKAE